MQRKKFFKAIGLIGAGIALPTLKSNAISITDLEEKENKLPPLSDRQFWVDTLVKIASPVLTHMSKGELVKNMVVEVSPTWDNRDKGVTYMECFGRLMAGIAPWLALSDDNSAEGKQRKTLQQQAIASYKHAVDPASPDYLLWRKEGQPLVDAAFIAHSFLRAPKALWEPLDAQTKQRYIEEFTNLRRVKPAYSNWLLFAAIIEAFLLSIGENFDPMRIDVAIKKMNEWYVGDGWYSDGAKFHFDYYNSYVIQPMLVDILDVWTTKSKANREEYNLALKRMQRYSDFMERLISPEGTFPAFGRSVTYRMGAFQPLAQIALLEKLPEGLTNGQVRASLTAVMKKMFGMPGNFSEKGWLQLGFAGHQPNIADSYSNNGSMYLTSLVFLPLGLAENHDFWTAKPEPWTSVKAWSGEPFKKDYAVNY